ncbi:polysaccharide pyruvyl transferase family protein [Phocaeicola sp.]
MKIGIITIHSIINYGSALQAYALQRYISSLPNCEAEIIDYVYPNKFHKKKQGIIKKMRGLCRITIDYLIWHKKARETRFKLFSKKFHNVSKERYESIESIQKNPPIYDIYATGSDQVWNIHSLKNDPVMYCFFAPQEAKKIAFGASMVVKRLPSQYIDDVRSHLSSYTAIGMREHSGVEIVHSLNLPSHIVIDDTCDPTLLLSASQYDEVIKDSKIKIKGNYVLVYYLDYAFNPHPAIEQVTEVIYNRYQLPIIFLGSSKIKYKGKYQYFSNVGPSEFVHLVKNAVYVVTSSFHGLMFSLIFRKAFTAIIPSPEENDTRITDVLGIVGLEKRVAIGCEPWKGEIDILSPYTPQIEENINRYINHSQRFLQEALKVKI